MCPHEIYEVFALKAAIFIGVRAEQSLLKLCRETTEKAMKLNSK
jgi:hypothetical protein